MPKIPDMRYENCPHVRESLTIYKLTKLTCDSPSHMRNVNCLHMIYLFARSVAKMGWFGSRLEELFNPAMPYFMHIQLGSKENDMSVV